MRVDDRISGLPLGHWMQFLAMAVAVGVAYGALSSQLAAEREQRRALEQRIEAVRAEHLATMRQELGEVKLELRRLRDRIDYAIKHGAPRSDQ